VDNVEEVVRSFWKGSKYVPDIIVELEARGVRMSEKNILDTAKALGLKGADVESRLYSQPEIIDRWWAEFEAREEESALKLLNAKDIKGARGIGKARHISGCTLADELNEKETPANEILAHLAKKGYESHEIEKIRKEVKF